MGFLAKGRVPALGSKKALLFEKRSKNFCLLGCALDSAHTAVRRKTSSSFLKKRTGPKKLFLITGARYRNARPNKQKFLLLFFKKKRFLASYVSTSRRARIAALIRCGSTIEKNISLDPNQLDQVPLPFQEVHMFFFVM